MTQMDNDSARRRIDELGARIEAKIRELKERGELASAHAAYLKEAQDKHARAQETFRAALREGKPLDAFKADALRDYEAVVEGLDRLAERLDADVMKTKR